MQNLIIALNDFDNTLSLIYYSKKSKNIHYLQNFNKNRHAQTG